MAAIDESISARAGTAVDDVDVVSFVCSCGKREGSVSISASTGIIEWKAAGGGVIRVCREDVLGVRQSMEEKRGLFARFKSRSVDAPRDAMVLSVIQRPSVKWHMQEHHLVFPSEDECSKCCERIESLPIDLSRPKNLLVFINPYSGDKKAVKVYESKAAPVFAAARIRADVKVTKRRNEARDFVENKANDLYGYDGIVAVGGDGTFAEVVQGLMTRVNGKVRPGDDIHAIELPITQIPAGSGNTIAFEATGTEDAMTSALHIACGHRLSVDAATVFNGDEMKGLTACMLTYGFFTDVIGSGERLRWLGPLRYRLTSVLAVMRFRQYGGTITLWPASADFGHPFDGQVCNVDCSRCSNAISPASAASDPPSSLETELAKSTFERLPDGSIQLRGSFLSILCAVHAVRVTKCLHGMTPFNHLCNGTMDITIVGSTERSNFGDHLKQIPDGIPSLQHPFVQTFRIRRFTFEPEEGSIVSDWFNDGEPLSSPSITAYSHRGIIRVFGRGVPKG